MPGKVFISCGQASDEERQAASTISAWLKSEGFDPYVAIETQSIQDVNSAIIDSLKAADYYIFIDNAREQIGEDCKCRPKYRGSLFTHQELSIAYFLQFERGIYLQEEGVQLEGIGKYILSNALRFSSKSRIVELIKHEFSIRGWKPDYSRHLLPVDLVRAGQWEYRDHAGIYQHHIWHISILNLRYDLAAFDAVARLNEIVFEDGKKLLSPDRNFLKWAGKIDAYSATILPRDAAKFDLLAIDQGDNAEVFLHSEEDRPQRRPVINKPGNYTFRYQVFSKGFPPMEFDVKVDLTGNIATSSIVLVQRS
jgi:hypothetical protein